MGQLYKDTTKPHTCLQKGQEDERHMDTLRQVSTRARRHIPCHNGKRKNKDRSVFRWCMGLMPSKTEQQQGQIQTAQGTVSSAETIQGDRKMKVAIVVLLIALCFLLIVCYSLVANSSRISREEERRKAMEKEKNDA